jgi:hypothetical protein
MNNRHPADRLADVRSQIKVLQAEEAGLRDHLIQHPLDRIGVEHVAVLKTQSRKRVDIKALRREVGDEIVQRHSDVCEVVQLRLRERGQDAA